MSRKRCAKAAKKPHPEIRILPNEVLMEGMKLSPAKEHAILLFMQAVLPIGRTLLYQCIWLTSFTSVPKLHRILLSPGGNELATQVRCFGVVIHHRLDWQTYTDPNLLINVLGAMRHVDDLHLHIEREHFSILLMTDPGFTLLSLPNLFRFAVTPSEASKHRSTLSEE
ncbi:hypothetical protein D9758_010958 [Tetrapyrgos nigripes]|uniref:Uncharacterized protein n=1 Tax=Tetrapyrgos nigripes TaxID=182062 RepID=A0A8H5GHW3_9AGAR|nr:hypothetical protein D9758_010958 [Tetrapyrgos nigripes]